MSVHGLALYCLLSVWGPSARGATWYKSYRYFIVVGSRLHNDRCRRTIMYLAEWSFFPFDIRCRWVGASLDRAAEEQASHKGLWKGASQLLTRTNNSTRPPRNQKSDRPAKVTSFEYTARRTSCVKSKKPIELAWTKKTPVATTSKTEP